MAIRTSEAEWRGDLKAGRGEIKLGSGAFTGSYSFHPRFEDGKNELLPGAGKAPTSAHCSTGRFRPRTCAGSTSPTLARIEILGQLSANQDEPLIVARVGGRMASPVVRKLVNQRRI
jgi:hypothetical protein